MMNHKTPEKPRTQKEQISTLWDAVYNHIFTHLRWQDVKMRFILALLGLIIALIGVLITLQLAD